MSRPLPAYAVILAGGRGTRFWPLSRTRQPKQFLALAGRESLLQQTYRRLRALFPRERILVLSPREQASLVRRQLPRLPPRNLVVEPVGRNTAAAIALAAAHIRHRHRVALLAVFSSDQIIAYAARFRRLVRAALATATAAPCAVVLGLRPTAPETGYGYIERGPRLARIAGQPVFRARRFTEKPDLATARRYLRTGRFFWNAGMFFWTLDTFWGLLERFLPDTARLLAAPSSAARLVRAYPRLPNISVDYALLERAPDVRLLIADIGWSDLGSWSALYDFLAAGPGANVSRTPLLALDARGNLLWTSKQFAAAVGVRDLIVVDTPDALLVCRRDLAQQVGRVVHYLERRRRRDLL